ncbi:MAG: tetratricopeptide repeat protein, partial [Alphaproteobacteria bacterium]
MSETAESVDTLRQSGRFLEALSLQRRLIAGGAPHVDDYWRLGLLCFATTDFAGAVSAFEEVEKARPDDLLVTENLGLNLLRCRRAEDGLAKLEDVLEAQPDKVNLLDGMADACGQLGRLEEAREYGERALIARDQVSVVQFPEHRVADAQPTSFRSDHPAENIIAFSLFGSGNRYQQGMIRNAEAAPHIYPGWRLRVYCSEDQPSDLVERLKSLGAEVRRFPAPARPVDGLFWRFQVIEDLAVRRFLIRDADSVINVRERVAVDEWLASDKPFHVMRGGFRREVQR